MQRSETIGKLAEALSKAQGELKGATKDSSNPYFKSRYADLSSVWEACRIPLSTNGLAVIQTCSTLHEGSLPIIDEDSALDIAVHIRVAVETMLVHSSGEWVSDIVSAK